MANIVVVFKLTQDVNSSMRRKKYSKFEPGDLVQDIMIGSDTHEQLGLISFTIHYCEAAGSHPDEYSCCVFIDGREKMIRAKWLKKIKKSS